MVRKVQGPKSKMSSRKPSSPKTKKAVKKLSNGYENPEGSEAATTDGEVSEVDNTEQNMDTNDKDNKEIVKDRKPSAAHKNNMETVEELNEQIKEDKTVRNFRKRKTPTVVSEVKTKKEKSSGKTKTKRQKVLEICKTGFIPGKLLVIGENDVGQLGLGEDVNDVKRPTLLNLPYSVIDIAAGGMHSVCLTESGEVITFGCNDEGALGRSTSEEGSEYIPRKVNISERVIQVSAGDSHSAALTESGQVYIWGNFRNLNGPMGLISDGIKEDLPVKILSGETVVRIASGSEHLVCLSSEGVVYTCGCGEAGQLGRVSEYASVDGGRKRKATLLTPGKVSILASGKFVFFSNIWTGSYATYVEACETKLIYGFGLNNYSQLGLENETVRFKPKQVKSFNGRPWFQIDGGQHHCLGLDDKGLVYSLGRKDYGRLGLGEDCDEKSAPTLIPTLLEEKCVNISCGNCVSFAVTNKGSVYSWGMGTNQQLGHGNDSDHHVPKCIEGSFFKSWKAHKISGGGQHTLILASPKAAS